MKKLFPLCALMFATIISSCNDSVFRNEEQQTDVSADVLMNADKNFSKMSNERGMKAALMHFMAREGTLLRPDENPLVGADAVEYISQIKDSGYTVSWHPQKADISGDGTMGYTFGIYEVAVMDTVIKGTYVNVWKKQNGEWRFVVNSGNQGTSSN